VSERFKVLVADGVSESGLQPLLENGSFEVAQGGSGLEALAAELADAHALIVRSQTKVNRALLEKAPKLQVVGRAGVGVDNIDLGAATERGIAVLNAPAGNTVSAAELTMALILSAARHISAADQSVRAGEWKRAKFGGMELRGKTLGLVGAGRIGGEVGNKAQAFGMRTLAYDPYLTDERAHELGLERAPLEEIIRRADVLSLHVPLTDQTRGMLGAEQLASMKKGAILVNVARGGVVDEAALADALTRGHLGGAALDVYDEEPLGKESPLRGAPNIVLTPHLGASTTEAQELVSVEISKAVADALLHGDLSRALNAPAIGGEAFRRLKPLLDLARDLGRLASVLVSGGIRSVEVRYAGAATEGVNALSAYTLMGLLDVILGDDQVNFVNAPWLAKQRGIGVSQQQLARRTDYTEFLELLVRVEGGQQTRVAGALLGDRHPRVVRIDDYHVDVDPRGTLLVIKNRDVPGVIGKVGTLLGEAGLNIAGYHQARLTQGGDALAAVALDGRVDREVIAKLKSMPEIKDARVVGLD
jgi:D-3-phosphoglycerate dehydrogenase